MNGTAQQNCVARSAGSARRGSRQKRERVLTRRGTLLCPASQLRRTPFGRSSRWHQRRVVSQAVLLLRLWSSQAVRFTSLAVAPLALNAATTVPPSRRTSNTSAPCSVV